MKEHTRFAARLMMNFLSLQNQREMIYLFLKVGTDGVYVQRDGKKHMMKEKPQG